MRRAHRRIHLLAWLILTPAVAVGVYVALAHRPGEPRSQVPDAIVEEAP